MKVKVESATQSPLNAKRWFLETSCRHGAWVTATKRPARKTINCKTCELPK